MGVIFFHILHVDGLVQDYSIFIADALEILQSYTQQSMFKWWRYCMETFLEEYMMMHTILVDVTAKAYLLNFVNFDIFLPDS